MGIGKRLAITGLALTMITTPFVNRPPKEPPQINNCECGDWLAAATNIRSASDFQVFEPMLQELAAEAPVPSSRIVVLPPQQEYPLAAGHYYWLNDTIYIEEDSMTTTDFLSSGNSLKNLGIWLHEQGHHYDHQICIFSDFECFWMREIEAEAFLFYVVEHIGTHCDSVLGTLLIRERLPLLDLLLDPELAVSMAIDIMDRTHSRPSDFESSPVNLRDRRLLKDVSLLILLGSHGSFRDVYWDIYDSSWSDLIQRLRENPSLAAEGSRSLRNLLVRMSGFEIPINTQLDLSTLQVFEPGLLNINPKESTTVGTMEGSSHIRAIGNTSSINMGFRHSPELDVLTLTVSNEIIESLEFILNLAVNNRGRMSLQLISSIYEDRYTLIIPDLTASEAFLIMADLRYDPSLFSSSQDVSINPDDYLRFVQSIVANIADGLRRGNGDIEADYLLNELDYLLFRANL